MTGTQLDRSQIDLSAAITARKALEASARRYRMSATTEASAERRAILIQRALECEQVARWLLNGADAT